MTMTTHVRLSPLLGLLGAALVGCVSEPPAIGVTVEGQTVASYTDPVSSLTFDKGTRAPMTEACPSDRFIGRLPSPGACPAPLGVPGLVPKTGHWQRSHLFDLGAGPPSHDLGRYCVYQWRPKQVGNPPVLESLPRDGPLPPDWIEPDCNIVAAQCDSYADQLAPHLQSAFLTQVEPPGPVGGFSAPTPVWIVDSAVDALTPQPGTGRLEHGRAMGVIVRRLTCDNAGGCTTVVPSSLSLRLRYGPFGALVRDDVDGGYFGSVGDLATSIYEATIKQMPGSIDRFVINLSLGWDPTEYGPSGPPSTLSPRYRAVYEALAFARCHGAVIIAAAGNASGGESPGVGPLYPAAWEAEPAPTPSQCSQLGVPAGPPPAVTSYTPLLYAVSGVDGADLPLMSARAGGRARLAAPAAHATLEDSPGSGEYTGVYSGTSVASAVTAAAVGAAWAYVPTMAGPDVMAMIRGVGVDQGVAADLCLGAGGCGNQRRISVCRAVAAACAVSGSCDPVAPQCPLGSSPRDARPAPLEPLACSVTATVQAPIPQAPILVGAPCDATYYPVPDATTVAPCPGRQLYSLTAEPWVQPQPRGAGCPTCGFFDGVLVLGLAEELPGVLTKPTLHVVDVAGTDLYYPLDVDPRELVAGAVIKVEDLDVDFASMLKAAVEFLVDEEYSISDELLMPDPL